MKQKKKILLPLLASALLLSCRPGTAAEQTAESPPAVPAMGVGRAAASPDSEPAVCGESVASGGPYESIRETETKPETEVVLERDLLVCIDPGHGFEDGGSGASEASFYPDGTLEKDVTITVAHLLKDALEKEGFRTVMTHDGKTIPEEYNWDGNDIFNPNERVALMNAPDPDYIVSIHTNAAILPALIDWIREEGYVIEPFCGIEA